MKRWLAILGPQQVVLISNTHTPGKHRKVFKDQEEIGWGRNQGSLVQVMGLAILGPQQVVLISNTHTENYFKRSRGDR